MYRTYYANQLGNIILHSTKFGLLQMKLMMKSYLVCMPKSDHPARLSYASHPLSHVNHIDGKNYVTVKRNNQLSIEAVTPGDTNQNMVQILTGLQEGDQIVQPN